MKKIVTILGARPQFIKAATVSRAIADHNKNESAHPIREVIVHTGQHFDANMSDVFFEQLDIPKPDYQLNISSLSHGAMTGRMVEGIERLLVQEKPDWVLVYGDTNSTLAGALAAAKLHIPIAHVEAGLRSNNMAMPEEVNRVLTDRVSDYLLCPTQTAVDNLNREGFPFTTPDRKKQKIDNFGDVMLDATIYYREKAGRIFELNRWGLEEKKYALCTLHRQENTDDPIRLKNVLKALQKIATEICQVVMPLHPRTRKKIYEMGVSHYLESVKVLDPLGYLEIQRFEMGARMILTDSGGVQKEAFFHGVPCITLRDETEWVETVDEGWNFLVGTDPERIFNAAFYEIDNRKVASSAYGKGDAGYFIVKSIADYAN